MAMSKQFESQEPARAAVDATDGAMVLEFGTPYCGFCRAAQPLIEEAFSSFSDVRHLKIEDGKGKPLGRSYRVKLWPTLIFLRDGQEVARLVRPTTAADVGKALATLG